MLQEQLLDVATLTPSPAPAPGPPLGLDARLAAVDAAMILRLEDASTAHTVDAARPETSVDSADLTPDGVQAYADAHRPAPTLYPTPVAALLQRAQTRLLQGGWCTGALADGQGAHCLLGSLRVEAGGDDVLEGRAAALLLEVMRRTFSSPDRAESIAALNDTSADARVPLRLLGQAAVLADARGL